MIAHGKLLLHLDCFQSDDCYQRYLEHPAVAGVLIPSQACIDEQQTLSCIKRIRKYHPRAIVLYSPDSSYQKWLENGCLTWDQLSKLYTKHPEKGKEQANFQGKKFALRLKYLGFNASLDIHLNPGHTENICNNISNDPHTLIGLLRYYIQGQIQIGWPIIAGLFPTALKKGQTLSYKDRRDLPTIRENDLLPFFHFQRFFKGLCINNRLYPKIDGKMVSESSYWINQVIRQDLNYNNAIIGHFTLNNKVDIEDHCMPMLTNSCDLLMLNGNRKHVDTLLNTAIQWETSTYLKRRLAILQGRYLIRQNMKQWWDALPIN